jgi:hypothetical protein
MQRTQQLRAEFIKTGGGILLRCSAINETEFQAFFPLIKATL